MADILLDLFTVFKDILDHCKVVNLALATPSLRRNLMTHLIY